MTSEEQLDAVRDSSIAAISPAFLARLRRVAASGKVGEEAGKEARREAAFDLSLYYSARPDGTYPLDDYDMMRQEARDLDAACKLLVAAALDGHVEASLTLYRYAVLKRKKRRNRRAYFAPETPGSSFTGCEGPQTAVTSTR